jgi:small subunit ribosomal protein S15
MALTIENKKTVIEAHQASATDVGSSAVQIALISARVAYLTEHLKNNKKDFAALRGLTMMVGKRRRLLRYYRQKQGAEAYKTLIESLNIRK